jgi:hypothetical protein
LTFDTDFNSEINKILSSLQSVTVDIRDIQWGMQNFSYDVKQAIENAEQWMMKNGKGSDITTKGDGIV